MGSRLGSALPKVLVPLLGRPMIDWIVELYGPWVTGTIIVANPASVHQVRNYMDSRGLPAVMVVQERPTGMLDALLLASAAVDASTAARVWVSWCDQVGVHPQTVGRLAREEAAHPHGALVLPTCSRPDPYIHFERSIDGRIVRVRQRREGDAMPDHGESDMGLFSLSRSAYLQGLPAFASATDVGEGTGERNFLPFIPWAESHGGVRTFPCTEPQESIGVNTPAELAIMEAYLGQRIRS